MRTFPTWPWFHRPVHSADEGVHRHVHALAITSSVIGLVGLILGPVLVPSLLAMGLGLLAFAWSRENAPDLDARNEATLGIILGIVGFLLGLVQLATFYF